MALTSKIIQKIKEKTYPDTKLERNLIKVLSDTEQGKQGKRSIDQIINQI